MECLRVWHFHSCLSCSASGKVLPFTPSFPRSRTSADQSSPSSFFGRILPNYAADQFGRFNVMILSVVLSAILVFGIWLPAPGTGALYAFAALFGFSSGASIGLGTVLVASISPMDELGVRLGIILVMAGIATLTGPPAAGGIVAAAGGSYTGACLMSGLSFIVSAVAMVLVRAQVGGWKLSAQV